LKALRERVYLAALNEVGVTERTGRNDHPQILLYHRSVSIYLWKHRPVAPYCGSFVNYAYKLGGAKVRNVDNPARARDWFRVPSRLVMTQQSLRGNRRMMRMPQKGDVVGYIFQKRSSAISHIEIFERMDIEAGFYWAVAGNTSNRNAVQTVNRDGDGVYLVRRKINAFNRIDNLIDP
jgi:hypothetical protein